LEVNEFSEKNYIMAPRRVLISTLLLLILIGVMAGCNNQAPGPDASASAAGQQPTSSGASAPSDLPVQVPVGVYVISEVDDKGTATMVNPGDEITIIFERGGTFSRTSKNHGQVIHTDNGEFHIEGRDQMVLKSTISDKSPVISDTVKTHKFELSTDGDELKLWGTGDRIAVFRRIGGS
jgi:hypothetical protein